MPSRGKRSEDRRLSLKTNNYNIFIMAGGTRSSNPQTSFGTKLDLKLIDESYGSNADLYEDVLRVPTTATQDEIQLAYFDRRSELFTLLAKIDAAARGPRSESTSNAEQQRYLAERKMDSVVFAVRILADPVLRKAYNGIRQERTGIPLTTMGYTIMPPQSTSTSNFPSISPSNSAGSESSTKSNGRRKKYNTDVQQPTPRAVTPPETPPIATASSSASESKNWIQSTFSSSIFSSISSSHSKTEDDGEDEERNPRKSKRRSKQNQVSSTSNRDREAEPAQDQYLESVGDKEKKSIWGRKKRKKKKQSRDELDGTILDDTMETAATDTSMTDNDESIHRNRTRDIDSRPILSMKSSTSNNDYRVYPYDSVRGDRTEIETVGDDDTRRDDDTRTYLGADDGATFDTYATDTVLSDDFHNKAVCGGEDGMFGCISGSRTFQKIATEVSGACEDTLVSVDQVFNAFTLTDKDIKAVKKKIDKVKRQLDN